MLRFLTGEDSTKKNVNENYGRELMELFCVGVTNAAGTPNYTEVDVREAARSATGWTIKDDDPDKVTAVFNKTRWDDGQKTVLGKTGAFGHRELVDVVLAHPNHAPYLVTKLWHEFIPTEPNAGHGARSGERVPEGRSCGIKPLVRRILTHPAMLDSMKEPNMIKPPVVLRDRDDAAPRPADHRRLALQRPERHGADPVLPAHGGGLGGRPRLAQHQHRAVALRAGQQAAHPGYATLPTKAPEDVTGETPAQAFARAHAAVGRPGWPSRSVSSLRYYAAQRPRGVRQRPHRAPARAAGLHARRPRRAGDVMDEDDDGRPRPASGLDRDDCGSARRRLHRWSRRPGAPITAEAARRLPRRGAALEGPRPPRVPAHRRPSASARSTPRRASTGPAPSRPPWPRPRARRTSS